MGRISLLLMGFVGGLLLAAAIGMWIVFPWVWGEAHSGTTEVWQAKRKLTLANGIAIPSGTEMTLDTYMPEGFVRLKLAINVEGEALDWFDKRTEKHPNLTIPYWVER
ncbi:MAG: hypothetical protein QNI96_06350 [Woeseiaceae bacterium]|nr:hypothetical protein [Woeseiaceae bacterium]